MQVNVEHLYTQFQNYWLIEAKKLTIPTYFALSHQLESSAGTRLQWAIIRVFDL